MLQYINVPIGCAVFRMAIGTLTYWHIVALTHYLFYFTQTSFRREINVFRIALISHLTTTGCFRSQRTGHITFHITRGTGTSSYIYRLHTFCLYIPTTTGSIRSVLTNTCQNYLSGRAGISRYISSVQILDRYITRDVYKRQAEYSYDQQYFLSASVRSDGSSRFHPDHRWGTFWSVGASWKIMQEEFMKEMCIRDRFYRST